MKKIVIVTPLFPPDVGGPAKQAFYLAELLKKENVPHEVLVYSQYHKRDGKLGHFYFFKDILFRVQKGDTVVVFDEMALGFSALLATRLRRATLLVRVGGDRLWERAVESGRVPLETLNQFYASGQYKSVYPFLSFLRKLVLTSANRVIFSSVWYQELLSCYLDIRKEKISLIKNKTEKVKKKDTDTPAVYTYIYAGRFTKVKNLPFLIRTFARLAEKNSEVTLLLLGVGPEEKAIRDEVARLPVTIKNRIFIKGPEEKNGAIVLLKETKVCVLPSLSDISPNFLLECSALGKPAVATTEIGIREDLGGVLYADPLNENAFVSALEKSISEPIYSSLCVACKNEPEEEKWGENWSEALLLEDTFSLNDNNKAST